MTREAEYLIRCVSAVMHQTSAPTPPEGLDWKDLTRLAAQQSMANLLCYAVEGLELPPEVAEKLRELKNKAILREATQEMELRAIRAAFSEKGIRFMPLKGVFLKTLYPRPDLRVMSDIDILFDANDRDAVQESMVSLGYTVKDFALGVTDVYQKAPIMNLEMHTELVDHPERWRKHFAHIWDAATLTGTCEFAMSHEDFYVFFLAHLVKHYANCGTGVRSILDLWVCRHKIPYDEAVVSARLEELGILEFVRNIEALAEVWFGEGTATPLLEEIGEFILSGGTFGNRTTAAMARGTKGDYFLRRLFLRREVMEGVYPILKKAPILLPACWAHRFVKKIFRPGLISDEIHILATADGDKAAALQAFHKRAGLSETYDE
ncbi:MAG: nucleotidyltransferase family protein [Oscillospiraceae bacterium]|nr:nucleotidyltransferase family protein [Oscillospiraceae bacterium]